MGIVPAAGYFNPGGLFSSGPFMLSFLLGAFTIVGFEAAANLAEETQDAHRVVPTAMWFSVVLSGIVGFAFLIALNLASGDIKALSGSATPVANIVQQTLGSLVGDIFLVFVTFSIFACGLVIFITTTRLTWAMSRDQRFPGYQLFRQVGTGTGTPNLGGGRTILGGDNETSVPGEPFNGDINELVLYNRALTGAEISGVSAYLNSRWGLS